MADLPKLRVSNLTRKHRPHTTWPMEKRIEVVSQYLVLGNMSLVSAITGVDHTLIRKWKGQPWWKDMETQVRATENLQMDNKLSKIVDKSLDQVLDRVENGEVYWNPATKQLARKPASLKDITKVSVDILTKRELLRGNATERKETTQISVAEQLEALKVEFAKWQSPPKKELELVEDITDIPESDIKMVQDDEDFDDEEIDKTPQESSNANKRTMGKNAIGGETAIQNCHQKTLTS